MTESGSLSLYQSGAECGARGDFISLPYTHITSNNTSLTTRHLGDTFLWMMYGVWSSNDTEDSQQYSRY